MRFLPLLFQVLLYRGSHVAKERYTPLLDSLRGRLTDLNATVEMADYSLFRRRRSFSESTVLVGHSFGGYFALKEAKHHHVEGVVLLYSHFNSQRTAWYPAVPQKEVTIPVLTLAGGGDRYLPLRHVLSDLWEKVDSGLAHKFYIVRDRFGHFSGLSAKPDNDTEVLARDIEAFVRGVHKKQFENVQKLCDPSDRRYSYQPLSKTIPRGVDLSDSVDMMDGLLKIVLKRFFWTWLHHIAFIMQKPTPYQNFVFTDHGDHILIKACNLSLEEVMQVARRSLPDTYETRFRLITVPSTLCGVYQWLLFPLASAVTQNGTIEWPILHLPVRDHIDYYKLVHPRQIILGSLGRKMRE